MRAILLLILFAVVVQAAPDEKKDTPSKSKELFVKEAWYKDQPGKEETFEGMLTKKKGDGGIGLVQRFNPYQLATVTETTAVVPIRRGRNLLILEKRTVKKEMTRDIYVAGKVDILDDFVGKKVKLIGKTVDMTLEGQALHEIWPARIELVDDNEKAEAHKKP
jgi:hypothetical protein